MAKIVHPGQEPIEVNGTFEEVLDRAFAEAALSPHCSVLLLTEQHKLLVKSQSSADDGNKVVYGWVRNYQAEIVGQVETWLEKSFPEAHVWISRDRIRVAYFSNTKSELLTMAEARQYINLLKSGYTGRWSERPREKLAVRQQGD